MDWDWNIIIGSAISFFFAVILLFIRELWIWLKERNRKKELFEDLFNGFSKLYDSEGCILLFRTIPLILDDIQKKLQMITSVDYKIEEKYYDMKIVGFTRTKDPTKMIAWMYNHLWYFTLDVRSISGTSEPDFSESLYDIKEKKYSSDNPEILIKFLTYLQDEYRDKNIIRKKKTLLTDEIIAQLKTHYSNKNGK
jgi:hypothetical protein